ncbi:MAG TPA: hypothetical protein VGB14_04190 [Acidimicrobiales bacterium]|jgi:hypothetical protein
MDDELVGVLRREHRLLELLLFRLVAMRHLLVAGDVRFLSRAAAEIRIALDRVRETEVLRAVLSERLYRTCGLDGGCTLRAIAGARPSPYGVIYDDLRDRLEAAFREAVDVSSSVEALATAGLNGLELQPVPPVGDHEARLDQLKARQGLEAALVASRGVILDSLAESLC